MKMTEKVQMAISYMKSLSCDSENVWVSPTDIGVHINGGDSSVGSPVCKELVRRCVAERNSKGHYRLYDRQEGLDY